MKELLDKIEEIEILIESNFKYKLDEEYDLILSNLKEREQILLKSDFDKFYKKGKFLIQNTFAGGILFLKESEEIEKIKIESQNITKNFKASVIYKSEQRNPENIKYKPEAGKIENTLWNVELIFPNFFIYQEIIQNALLLIIGKVVKKICEYGKINFAHMKIENEFSIELLMSKEIKSKLKVEIK
jgi:hypothetical protein